MGLGSFFAKQAIKSATKNIAKEAIPAVAKDVIPTVVDTPVVSAPARKSLVTRKQTSNTPVVDTPSFVDDIPPTFMDEIPVSPVSTVDKPLSSIDNSIVDSFVTKRIDRTEDFGIEPDLIAKENEDAFDVLGITAESKEKWRKENKSSQRQGLLPEIEEAAQKLSENKISSDDFRALSQKSQPIIPMEKVPEIPSFEDITNSLTEAQVKKGIVGVNMKLPANERVSSRLDIPAYNDYNTWVVSLHDGSKKSGAAIGYAKTAILKNVEFVSDSKVALDIARRKPLASGGRMGKATIARIFGDWVPHDPNAAKAYAEKVFKEEGWSQIGMNPYRASYFYDKADGMPVISADEIVQIGPLVMAKNVKKTTPKDPMFKVNPKEESSPTFATGGTVVQTNKMLAQDGVLQKGGTVDPVSGNDVPPGAMPEEVRDDVDAKLSEGEFVVPADVVRYIGLAKLMEMRDEAKRGLQKMTDIGQMGNSKKGAEGEALHGEEGEDEEFASSIDEIMSEEEGGEEEAAYAKGGYVPRASGYDPAESVSLYSRAPIKGFEMIPMSNDTGNTIYIPFINGKPQLQIPPGYVIKAKAGAEAATPVAPTVGGTGTTATQGGEGGQDFGDTSGDTGGLPPASDRTDFRSAVLSIPDFMKFAPVVGTPITMAKAWAEKAAAADKAYLSPFEAPMVAAREAFTKSERDAAGLAEANAKMETARSDFTAKERAKVINDIIDASIAKKTDPEVEMDAMFAAFAPTPTATAVEQGVLSPGAALASLPPETTKPTAMLDPAQIQQAKEAEEAAALEAAQNAREAREARGAADREAAAQSARETANREAAAQSAREAAAATARATDIAGSVSGDGGYGGFGGTTGGGDTMGFGGEYAKGGVVTKKDKGFVSARQHSKNKRTGFVAKK